MAVKPSNLVSPLGIGKIFVLIIGIIVVGLAIASRPYEEVRKPSEDPFSPDELTIFVLSQDIFFYGFFVPFLLTVGSIILSVLGSKAKALEVLLHGFICILALAFAGFLLYGIVAWYDFISPACRPRGTQQSLKSMYDDTFQCFVDNKDDSPEDQCLKCIVKMQMKYGTSIASGAIAVIFAISNLVLAVMTLIVKR